MTPARGGHSWVKDEAFAHETIRAALEAGINFFDTANVYSAGTSEEFTGRALQEYADREDVVLATKVHGRMRPGPNGAGLSRKAILHEIDASLSRLGTDYVDLYQIHRWDPADADRGDDGGAARRRAGPARPATSAPRRCTPGSSPRPSTSPSCNGWTPFVSMQNHYNLLYREEEREMLPLCADQGVGVIPWSPLARGRLTRPWDTDHGAGRDRRVRRHALPRRGRARSSRRCSRSPSGAACRARRSRWRGCWRSRPSPHRSSA